MSKFQDIFFDIETKIINQEFKPGELLPSEHTLSAKYEVSRETIRKALALLLESGYIQKKQGKGSIVLDVKRFDFPVSGLTSYKEIQDSLNIKTETKVIKNTKRTIPKRIADFLNVPDDTEVHEVIRTRIVDGEAIILDKDYLFTSVIPKMPTERAEISLYEYFEQDLHLNIDYARKEFTVEPITQEDRDLLTLYGDTHVVVARSDVHLKDTTLFQYTESRHRLDKFRFVDFARRRGPVSY